nr:MAG TPA: hypothetical protein [Caudoviricetes sp.]
MRGDNGRIGSQVGKKLKKGNGLRGSGGVPLPLPFLIGKETN